MCENPIETPKKFSEEWWATPEAYDFLRPDLLRFLAFGLTETGPGPDPTVEPGTPLSGLLIGVGGLRNELLAWAEAELQKYPASGGAVG